MHILILGGGISPEHDVSIRSAAAVRQALEYLGHQIEYLDPVDTSEDRIMEVATSCDLVFPILHGEGGEDGGLQALFEQNGIKYLGSGSQSCKKTFDKSVFKQILITNSLPTPDSELVTAETFLKSKLIAAPFVLKPVGGGSSIDTFIVREIPGNTEVMLAALKKYDSMLLEELIEGTEVTVGILDETPLPVIEIIPPENSEFDYENKYNGATQELCPPQNVSQELQQKAQELALKTHQIMDCRHFSRTDIMTSKGGEMFIIDTNTIPGLTDQSLFPKAAKVAGYEWNNLVEKFVELAAN